ncbi:MAG: peptidase S8, partial [Chloroflexi bacterium]
MMISTRRRASLVMLLTAALLLALVGLVQAQGPDGGRAPALRPVPGALQHVGTYHLQKSPLVETDAGSEWVSVIVDLEAPGLAAYDGSIAGLAATSPSVTGASRLDVEGVAAQSYLAYVNAQIDAFESAAAQRIPQALFGHRFDVVLGGVGVVVPADRVEELRSLPGVRAVYPDRLVDLATDRSPDWIGAPAVWDALGGQATAGEGVVVGIIDSGIWPEHPSFSDPDPAGNPYPDPPGGPYACEFGNTEANANDAAFECNNKLLGAARTMDTADILASLGQIEYLPGEFISARDNDGHGTHVASTAAGNGGVMASLFGNEIAEVSGIAPRAQVLAYKICFERWTGTFFTCSAFTSDMAAAIQQGLVDGAQVMNLSFSGGSTPYEDASSLAFLDAYAAGVFVAAAAGNSGPDPDTVGRVSPWVTTVAASTHDGLVANTFDITGPGDVPADLTGIAAVEGTGPHMENDLPSTPIIYAGDVDPENVEGCNAFPAGAFDGAIALISRGTCTFATKVNAAAAAGAVAVVVHNNRGGLPFSMGALGDTTIPSFMISLQAGQAVVDWIQNNPGVTAQIGATVSRQTGDWGDTMADFSSRGGTANQMGISKPDITAPGVDILAGNTAMPNSDEPPGELFQAISGTSMASPHVAGAGALLKALHPDWTPGQIKSALMTTAVRDVVKEDGTTPADAFDFGSGRVNLNQAGDPGLTFDVPAVDFINARDHLWDVNYPSLYVPNMPGSFHVRRVAHSEVDAFTRWTAEPVAGDDWSIGVTDMFAMDPLGEAVLDIWIDASHVPAGEVRMGGIRFTSNRGHTAWFPITFVKRNPAITLEKSCDPTEVAQGDTTTCTISISNIAYADTAFTLNDRLPPQLQLIPESVTGAAADGNGLFVQGGLGGAAPPLVDVAVDPTASPAGYLALSGFGSLTVSMSDESISVWNVPSFQFAGQTYNAIGVVSNGYIVLGGGDAGDVDYINQALPDPARPNNVLAPFWTDLNPDAGGQGWINVLTDGVNDWIVVEWEEVPNFGDGRTNTFQVWIGTTTPDDVSFTYGPSISDGDGGALTVGAENESGTSGGMVY